MPLRLKTSPQCLSIVLVHNWVLDTEGRLRLLTEREIEKRELNSWRRFRPYHARAAHAATKTKEGEAGGMCAMSNKLPWNGDRTAGL